MPRNAPIDSAWYGFLVMGFAVVGLAGIFGTYACQLPFQRGEAAEQVLDRAAATHGSADIIAMQSDLGDNYRILADTSTPLAARIATARAATRQRTILDARDIARRLRVVIGVITGGAALFGCMLLGAAAHQRKE